uniref:Putative lateral signaling target protein 2 n=2 Tax=Anopheles triannulatus TaxID=58253 RepID=A0A2M4AAG4_9DIPT
MLPIIANCGKFYNRLSILVTVFITVNLARIRAENCGQEELTNCVRPFQVIQSPSDLSIATKREDLDRVCPDLNHGLQCIRSYTRRCMNLEQRNHFNQLYNGTHQFVRDLCREGEYQKEFLAHAPCLQLVRPDYEVCGRRYHQTVIAITQQGQPAEHHQHNHQHHHHHQHHDQEHHQQQQLLQHNVRRHRRNHHTASRTDDEDDVQKVCCSFLEYLDCSEAAARKTCGAATAQFTRGFLDKMSSTLIKMYCEDYYKSNKCPSMYSSAATSTWSLHSVALMLIPTVFSTLRSTAASWWTLRSTGVLHTLR